MRYSSQYQRRRRRGGGGGLLLDLPLTHVATLDEVLADVLIPTVGLSSIKLAWAPPDANAPRIWLGAVNTTDRLTLTGVPTAVDSPWVDSNGTRIQAENCAATVFRNQAATSLDPSATDDWVGLLYYRPHHTLGGNAMLSSFSGRGIFMYNTINVVNLYILGDVALVPSIAANPCGWQVAIGIVSRATGRSRIWSHTATVDGATPAGALGGAGGIGLFCHPGGGNAFGGAIAAALWCVGSGIAAPFLADTYALPKRITRLLTGIEPRSGGGSGVVAHTRATVRSWYDGAGRLHFASAGLPCAGDAAAGAASGLRIAPTRTNKVYNTINPTATTGWTASGGTHSHSVDDSAALATAKIENAGPYVHRFVPGAGDEEIYGGAATATTGAHSLSCYLRGAAGGESVDICLRDASSGALQVCDTVALTTGWVRYFVHGVTPDDTDQVFCLDCDAGDTVYFTLPQLEAGARCTSPIPNWATAAAATRIADTLDPPLTPSDAQGALECGVTPIHWADTEAGDCLIVDRVTGTGELLRADSAGGLATDDGTTEVRDTTTALVDGTRVAAQVSWGPSLDLVVDGTRETGAYDGALGGSGLLRLEADLAEVAVDSIKVYRRYR
jgi:hypothetical protein